MLSSLWLDARSGFRTLRSAPSFSITAITTLALGVGGSTALVPVAQALLDGAAIAPAGSGGAILQGPPVGRVLVIMGAVVAAWAIACATMTALLLARGAQRHGEMEVRAVLGADRGRLAAQCLTESLCLALLGGAGGLLVAAWVLEFLNLGTTGPGTVQWRLTPIALLFDVAMSLAAGLVFGGISAWRASRDRDRAERGERRRRRWPLRAALSVEVVVTMTLVALTAILLRDWAGRSLAAGNSVAGTVLLGFTSYAALLVAVGLHGALAYSVALRRREFAVRIAVGASRRSLGRLVLGEALTLIAPGVGAGLLLGWVGWRIVSAQLPGSGLPHPVTLLAAALAIGVVALAAGYLPARRAGRIDPMPVLRAD